MGLKMSSHNKTRNSTGYVKFLINSRFTKADKERLAKLLEDNGEVDVDAFVDQLIHERKTITASYPKRNGKKKNRPCCGAKTKSYGGRPCQAKPVWDKKRNKPVNGRCRMHGGLATGAKTQEGMKRVLQNLKWHRSNPQYEHNVKQLKARNNAILEDVTLRGVHGQKCKLYRELATKYNVSYATIRYVVAQSKKPSSNLSSFK